MEQTFPDYVFWYCNSDENRSQGIGHNLMAISSLLWPDKVYFCHQMHKILNFETDNMVKNGANSTRIVYSGLVIIVWPFLAFYGPKRYFLPPEAQNTQFGKRKLGQKWSKLYQTMCFDTALLMKIVYSGLVIIVWPFLAF